MDIGGEIALRLDKWLKLARVIKRRTVANEICDQGRVTINGRPAKASVEVKPHDRVSIRFGTKLVALEILQVPAGQVAAQLAPTLYAITGETSLRDLEDALAPAADREEA